MTTPVENVLEQMPDTGPTSAGRDDIAATVQHISLGAAYRHVRIWLSTGSAVTHIRVDTSAATAVAATDSYPAIDESCSYARTAQGPGFTYIHHIGASAAGKLNWEAW